jgi:hypothetical protein
MSWTSPDILWPPMVAQCTGRVSSQAGFPMIDASPRGHWGRGRRVANFGGHGLWFLDRTALDGGYSGSARRRSIGNWGQMDVERADGQARITGRLPCV